MSPHAPLTQILKAFIAFTFFVFFAQKSYCSQVVPDNTISVTSGDTRLCIGESTNITLQTTELGVRYQLRNNNSGQWVSNTIIGTGIEASFNNLSPITSTSYTVVATHIASSESIELSPEIEIEVLSLPLINMEVNTNHNSLCVGESINISIEDSEPDVYYQIEGGANTNEVLFLGNGNTLHINDFKPFRSATYHINAKRESCETVIPLTDLIPVDVRLSPETQLYMYSDKKEICQGDEVTISLSPSDTSVDYQLITEDSILGGKLTGNGGFIDFEKVSPEVSTTYHVNAKGHFCIDPVNVNFSLKIDVHEPVSTNKQLISNQNEICEGEPIIISLVDSQEEVIYQLHDGQNFLTAKIIGNGETANFPEIYPNQSTNYSAYAKEMTCPHNLKIDESVHVKLIKTHNLPIENLVTPGEICLGETVDIELPLTEEGIIYHLYDRDIDLEKIKSDGGSLVFENLTADIDSEFIIHIDNCVDEVIAAKPELKIHSKPQVDIITRNESQGKDGEVTVAVYQGKAPFTYIFENYKTVIDADNLIELRNLKAGDYKLAVIDANLCKSTTTGHEFKIDFDNEKNYVVNKVLTPNGDGRNDSWTISYKPEWEAPEVTVFNIYGQKVYHSSKYQNDWKGTYNKSKLPNGSYFYLVEFNRSNTPPVKGILSILGN